MTTKREIVKQIISAQENKMFSVEFLGVDGNIHTFNGRLGVKKYLHGGKNTTEHCDHLITVFNVHKKAYRKINLDGVIKISGRNAVHTFMR